MSLLPHSKSVKQIPVLNVRPFLLQWTIRNNVTKPPFASLNLANATTVPAEEDIEVLEDLDQAILV